MYRSLRSVWFVLPLCLLPTGCRENSPPPPAAAPERAASPPGDASPVAEQSAAIITVQVGSWTEVQQMVAGRRGKVVVVDVWSTWCEPCVREFPKLVQLHRQFPNDVACISVNVDYIGVASEPPESFRDKVLEFVRRQEASFPNVICNDPDEEVLKALGAFSVPVVQIYDRDGDLRQTFTNDDGAYGDAGFTYEQHIIPLVGTLTGG